MKTKDDIIKAITEVKHPAIANSLLNLGIVKDVELKDNIANVIFAFPFPEIPIADQLVYSIYEPIKALGVDFNYDIIDMTEEEKATFMKLEAEGWQGM